MTMMTIEQWSLKVRWLITKKEALIANANLDTAHRDGWLCDYNEALAGLDKQLEELFSMEWSR